MAALPEKVETVADREGEAVVHAEDKGAKEGIKEGGKAKVGNSGRGGAGGVNSGTGKKKKGKR